MQILAGAGSDGSINVEAPGGEDAMITLNETSGPTFQVLHEGDSDRMVIRDQYHELHSLSRLTDSYLTRGDVTVLSGDSGVRQATVKSIDDMATLVVAAGPHSNGHVWLRAPEDQTARVTLLEGNHAFSLLNDGSKDQFVINDGFIEDDNIAASNYNSTSDTELFTIHQQDGDMRVRGDMSIGPSSALFVNTTNGNVTMKGDLTIGMDPIPAEDLARGRSLGRGYKTGPS